jgi:RNA polymerase sigma-70 factor, ECF subfamily
MVAAQAFSRNSPVAVVFYLRGAASRHMALVAANCERTPAESAQNDVYESTNDRISMSAFRDDVEAMIPALRRYARALARDADVADDLVQDTLVRALRSERLFLGGDIRSWLYTILTNLNRNRRRSLARRPQFTPLLDNNAEPSGTEAESRDIARALATLVEDQRSVLLLVMLEGLSYREVADIQGVPIGTVMSRLARARAHVKASLEGERPVLRQVK